MAGILWGVLGTMLTLIIICAAFFGGWKANDVYRAKTNKAVARELSEKEKKRQQEDNEAFHTLLNYSADTAYGIKTAAEVWGE